MLEFGLDDVAVLLMLMHDLKADQETALDARLKHFQRLRFPHSEGFTRGERATYDLEGVLKVVVAFQLLETGQPSVRAVSLVLSGWEDILAALLKAWRAPRRTRASSMIVVETHALAGMGRRGFASQAKAETIEVVTKPLLSGPLTTGAARGVVLIAPLMTRLAAALEQMGQWSPQVIEDSFMQLISGQRASEDDGQSSQAPRK